MRLTTATTAAALLVIAVALGGCGSSTSSTSVDKKVSQLEGYSVSNCRTDATVDQIGREVDDPHARAYDCSKGLGVVIEPDGQFSDYDASSEEQHSTSLTAAQIAAKIIDTVTAKNGSRLKRVDCGSSTAVQSGSVLTCKITMPSGQARKFTAAVSGSPSHFHVELGT
jgi:hypothetical protein